MLIHKKPGPSDYYLGPAEPGAHGGPPYHRYVWSPRVYIQPAKTTCKDVTPTIEENQERKDQQTE